MKKRVLSALLMNILFVCAVYASEECDFVSNKFYIYMTGDMMYTQVDRSIYEGAEFPIYCGYVEFDDKTITFTQKAKYPVGYLVEFFEKINRTKVMIKPFTAYHLGEEDERAKVKLNDSLYFPSELYHVLRHYYHGLYLVFFSGDPDENYQPYFIETCIYSTKKGAENDCSSFSVPAAALWMPVSNELRCRSKLIDRKVVHEKFNEEKKRWEVIEKDKQSSQ